MAREIAPVSSETTTQTASVCSLTPSAARCLIPALADSPGRSVYGSTQAAATSVLPRITTAPSCNGDLGWKIDSSNSAETRAASVFPVRVISINPTSRWKTISAPMWLSEKLPAASTTSLMVCWMSSASIEDERLDNCEPRKPALPSRVSAVRSSGWKMITSAMMPGNSIARSR
jgi:hypothetical protein